MVTFITLDSKLSICLSHAKYESLTVKRRASNFERPLSVPALFSSFQNIVSLEAKSDI